MKYSQKGFTLVEMIVSVALFAIVMTICVDVMLSLVNANRKTQGLQSVMNNLNIALDGMVRSIREGSDYRCGTPVFSGSPPTMGPQDCSSTNDSTSNHVMLSFETHDHTTADQPWVYLFATDSKGIGRIYRSETGNCSVPDQNGCLPITAPEVSIQQMQFYVVGSTRGDQTQPKVIVVIQGSAGAIGTKARTTFHIQATAVQRVLDI